MDIPFYQIDAFTGRVFVGNPARHSFFGRRTGKALYFSGLVVQHVEHFLICDPRILYRVGNVSMTELALHCRDVPVLSMMTSQGVLGRVWRVSRRFVRKYTLRISSDFPLYVNIAYTLN